MYHNSTCTVHVQWMLDFSVLAPDVIIILSDGNSKPKIHHRNPSYGVCTRAGKKVRIFEPSFICYAFEVKLLPSKLRCHAHFNVCTCSLVQSKCVVNNVGVFHKS